MNYANDEVFNVIYDRKERAYKLETKKQSKIVQAMKQYKFITLLVITAITFSIINFVLITSFFKLLGSL